jgi:hypothetical protein
MKVMGDMFTQWKRGYSLKDSVQTKSCCVCLEDFQKDEEIVELHCGKGHIFHPNCIKDWARQHDSCPL